MKVQSYQCDKCGVQKKEANHWYKLVPNVGFHLFRWDYLSDEKEPEPEGTLHYCSEGCVMKALSGWMTNEQIGWIPLERIRENPLPGYADKP